MTQKDSLNIRDKGDKMKTKLMLLLFALTLGACKSDNDTPEDRAKRMGLECINGWVFQIHYDHPFFGRWKTTLIPLNVECPSGKVEVN